jgi:hypothetical protein
MSFLLAEDAALKEKLKGFHVQDEKNSNREVGVYYAMPDTELRSQSFPFITIEMIDTNWAAYRQSSGLIIDESSQGTQVIDPDYVYTYETPVAWDIVYQVTTYARHPLHDRQITAHLLSKVFPSKRGYLVVADDANSNVTYRHLILEEFTKRDTVLDGRRLYSNAFTVTVSSEGQAGGVVRGQLPERVVINETIDNIPIDQLPV